MAVFSLSSSFAQFLWMLTCCFLICDAASHFYNGLLEVRLAKYSNPQNRNALNQCCDGLKNASTCTDSCDIFIAIFVQAPRYTKSRVSDIIHQNASEFHLSRRSVMFSNGSTDLLSIPFQWAPKHTYSFLITLYDDDSTTRKPNLDKPDSYETVINFTQELPSTIKPTYTSQSVSKDNISITFLYRLKCNSYYFGELCEEYCRAMNTRWERSTCLVNGTKICLPGWQGNRCADPICPDDCSNHGQCMKPGVCKCDLGWRGESCSECIPHPDCLHATCTDPLQHHCVCKDNWVGQLCDVVENYCQHYRPCMHGKCFNSIKSNFSCDCSVGWTGKKCDISLCPVSCNRDHASCRVLNNCSCHAGWTGTDCNECIPSPNCVHGNCTKPSDCICKEGWKGENCDEPVPYCKQRNPCKNNGACRDVAIDKYHCLCMPGFIGEHCQDKDLCSARCQEGQGVCEKSECRCFNGWQGPNCTECVRNSSCINGYCRKPFECLCYENWTGPFCNISTNDCLYKGNLSRCGKKKEQVNSDDSVSDILALFSILTSVVVFLLVACMLYLAWRHRRRRASFHVSSSEIVANNLARTSCKNGKKKSMLNLNNNVSGKLDFANYPSSEIVLNPMTLQPSENSRSVASKTIPDNPEKADLHEFTLPGVCD